MAERISRQMLDGKLRTLNYWIVGNPDPPHSTPHSYTISKQLEGYRLERYMPPSFGGGIGLQDVSPRGSKRDVFYFVEAMLYGIKHYRESQERESNE